MLHFGSSAICTGLCAAWLLACSAEPKQRDAVFGGTGALVKELPLAPAPASSGTGPCAQGVPPSDVALVDDFEDGDNKPFKGYHREAWWFTVSDHTEGSKLSPDGKFAPARLAAAESNPPDNLFAAHVEASGQTEWGALFATTLRWSDAGVRCPLNVSAFRGVKFRAKGPGSVRFKVDVPGTTPTDYGGECAKGCYDAPGKVITLSDHWDEYVVPWDRLQQGGWGTEVRFDPARVLGVGFAIDVKALPADFWIDDIALIPKATAP
jgi:hypothetical protein